MLVVLYLNYLPYYNKHKTCLIVAKLQVDVSSPRKKLFHSPQRQPYERDMSSELDVATGPPRMDMGDRKAAAQLLDKELLKLNKYVGGDTKYIIPVR